MKKGSPWHWEYKQAGISIKLHCHGACIYILPSSRLCKNPYPLCFHILLCCDSSFSWLLLTFCPCHWRWASWSPKWARPHLSPQSSFRTMVPEPRSSAHSQDCACVPHPTGSVFLKKLSWTSGGENRGWLMYSSSAPTGPEEPGLNQTFWRKTSSNAGSVGFLGCMSYTSITKLTSMISC